MQNQEEENLELQLCKTIDVIPQKIIDSTNNKKGWKYGYNEKYDVVVISKTGQISEVVDIQGLKIALPLLSEEINKRNSFKMPLASLPSIHSSRFCGKNF